MAASYSAGTAPAKTIRATAITKPATADTSMASLAAGASLFVCGTSVLFARPGGYASNLRRLRSALTKGSPVRVAARS